MKKMNNKGFLLTEALVVSVLITTVLTALYVNFKNVSTNVSDSFKYDSISSMYSLKSIRDYIEQENYVLMVSGLDFLDYVDISDCSSYYFSNTNYCKSIFDSIGIEKIIITKENMYSLINNKNSLDSSFKKYIKKIKYEKTDGYRLIASFIDKSYANIEIFEGDDFLVNIANACSASTNKKYIVSYIDESLNSSIIDNHIGYAGCGTILEVNDFIDDVQDSCYVVSDISTNSIVIDTDESLNKITIPYSKVKTNVTINYLDLSNNSIMPSKVQRITCGQIFNSSDAIVQKTGYVFDHASDEVVEIGSSDIEINLFYKEAE